MRRTLALLTLLLFTAACTKAKPEAQSTPDNSSNWAVPGVSAPAPQQSPTIRPTVGGRAGEIDAHCKPYVPEGDIYSSLHGNDEHSLAPQALKNRLAAAGLTYYLSYSSSQSYDETWIVKRTDDNESCVQVLLTTPGKVKDGRIVYDYNNMRMEQTSFTNKFGIFNDLFCVIITDGADVDPDEALGILKAALATALPLKTRLDYTTESGKPDAKWRCTARM